MKKIYSLIKACMSSDMKLFKIKTKKNSKKTNIILPLVISLYFMFVIWSNANILFEKLAPIHLQYIVLSLFVFFTSVMVIIEGIYKAGPLMFNCKDDDLLLSLPINKRTVLFIRMFKFYIFELLFNSIFILPLIIAYIRWADTLYWTFYLTSFVMLLLLPIIPIVISCVIGVITSSLSSRFKYKNMTQIILSMIILLLVLYLSFNVDSLLEYLVKNATSINDLITKIYYPAGIYAKLAIQFNLKDFIIFIVINIVILVISIIILSKFYFKINSRLKEVVSNKKTKVKNLVIRKNNKVTSLVKKELNTFFKTPVFIINAGFALVLFIVFTIIISIKFDSTILLLTDTNGINMSKELITSNLSIFVFILISVTSYMTSITNSVISLEGKNINILKTLPLSSKKILMSKIYSGLVLTTPVLLIGDVILLLRFKISLIESVLLIILSILIPLVSHFIGLLVNLRYPKLDAENSTEVVKQSMSSFVAVMIGMILLIVSIVIVTNLIKIINSTLILLLFTIIYIIINYILYLYLSNIGVKKFNKLSV